MKTIAFSFAAALAAATGGHAAVVGYTSEAAWLAAAGGGLSFEGFDGIASDTSFAGAPLDVGDFTISYTGSISGGSFNYIDTLPPSSPNNLFASNAMIGGVNEGETVTLTFDSAITSFGASFAALNDNADRSVFEVGGSTLQLAQNTGLVIEFFGVVSDTPFTEFTLRGLAASEGYGMDNVRYGVEQTVVPLPASALLLGSGLALVGGLSRRRRRS
ncbi:hypothetical protein Ga0609869_003023 [Rhodovulum iodosum]|uniref:VPLPA-CTERM sorting domain-containing protein n=1 Tax=Rhodovulum iodosum TaxID=68291 RepID=A0ABV3XY44_9RHOB|nr:hypothetical protein [Rhodovulum robiginosum]RSK36800.1 hypothetical protein EJA01_04705 [Rhodovulum robiginosum]